MEFIVLFSRGNKAKTCKRKQRSSFAFNKETNINALKGGLLIILGNLPTSGPQHRVRGLPPLLGPPPALSQPIDCNILIGLTCTAFLSSSSCLHGLSPGSGLPHLSPDHLLQPRPMQRKSPRVVFRPAASAPPGNSLGMQVLKPLSRPPPDFLQRPWGWSPAMADLTSPLGDCSLKTENHRSERRPLGGSSS